MGLGGTGWPFWWRALLAGVWFAGAMFVYRVVVDDGPLPLVAALSLGAGLVFGPLAAAVGDWQERRLLGPAGKRVSAPDRTVVLRAVRAARPPEDPRLAATALAAARRLVETGRGRVVATVVVTAELMALGGWLAIAYSRWFWLFALFWLAAGGYSVARERRDSADARRYLRVADRPVECAGDPVPPRS